MMFILMIPIPSTDVVLSWDEGGGGLGCGARKIER